MIFRSFDGGKDNRLIEILCVQPSEMEYNAHLVQ